MKLPLPCQIRYLVRRPLFSGEYYPILSVLLTRDIGTIVTQLTLLCSTKTCEICIFYLYMFVYSFRVDNFAADNNGLKKKIASLEMANRSLIIQVQKLQGLVATKVGKNVTSTKCCQTDGKYCYYTFLNFYNI